MDRQRQRRRALKLKLRDEQAYKYKDSHTGRDVSGQAGRKEVCKGEVKEGNRDMDEPAKAKKESRETRWRTGRQAVRQGGRQAGREACKGKSRKGTGRGKEEK